MVMMQKLLHEGAIAEAEPTKAEHDSQRSSADFMKDSHKGIAQQLRAITNKTDEKAVEDHSMAENDALSAMESLSNPKKQLHDDYDFILKNFEVRLEARALDGSRRRLPRCGARGAPLRGHALAEPPSRRLLPRDQRRLFDRGLRHDMRFLLLQAKRVPRGEPLRTLEVSRGGE